MVPVLIEAAFGQEQQFNDEAVASSPCCHIVKYPSQAAEQLWLGPQLCAHDFVQMYYIYMHACVYVLIRTYTHSCFVSCDLGSKPFQSRQLAGLELAGLWQCLDQGSPKLPCGGDFQPVMLPGG